MKTLCFLFYTLIALIFGLTACHSDKLPDDFGSSSQVGVRNSSISYNQLRDIKIIDVTSSIFLDFRDSESSKNHSQVKSKCWNNYLEDFSGSVIINNTESLPVRDILPTRVFTPSSNLKPDLFCDFEINIFNGQGQSSHSKISLKEINVRNIETYSNLDWPLKNMTNIPGKPFYIQKKDIKDVNLAMPTDEGEIFILCENSGKIHSFNEQQTVPMNNLFDWKLFEDNNIPLCRLVVHQQSPEKNWVTQAFFIQNQEPKITYQYRHHYTAGTENRWDGQEMGVLILVNEGVSDAYLQIPTLSTKVSVMSAYSNFSKKNINHRSNQILDLNVFWVVDNGIPVEKEDKKSPPVYKLAPGQSLSLSLKTNDGFLCEKGQPVMTHAFKADSYPGKPGSHGDPRKKSRGHLFYSGIVVEFMESNCREIFYLSGIFYHLHQFPKITFNLFETMDHQKWQPLPLERLIQRQYDGQFSQWVPNYAVTRHCLGLEIKYEIKNYPTQNNRLSSMFECRLDRFK